jgi:SAM-dependent methyltransferase
MQVFLECLADRYREGVKSLSADLAIAPAVPPMKEPCFYLQQLMAPLGTDNNRHEDNLTLSVLSVMLNRLYSGKSSIGTRMWDHGYFTGTPYIAGYYREMAPIWMDFAGLIEGHPSPRSAEGAPFHYLELGSGLGLHLCLMAAAYPEGLFVGVDLMPDHIYTSRRFAERLGLDNIKFIQGDLLDLDSVLSQLASVGIGFGSCDYVAAHGIFTWVDEKVKESLLKLATHCLKAGGYFYCSYNTYPGWLARSAFYSAFQQDLADIGMINMPEVLEHTREILKTLIGSDQSISALGAQLPGFKSELDALVQQDTTYLSHEFGNRSWQPVYVRTMHEKCKKFHLSFKASATLPEIFDDLLPEPVRSAVLMTKKKQTREVLKDLGIMQSFRRDLFVYGNTQLPKQEHERLLGSVQIRLLGSPIECTEEIEFKTSLGVIQGGSDAYRSITQLLAQGPLLVAHLISSAAGLDYQVVIRCLALLVHAERVGLDRGAAAGVARGLAQRINTTILEMIQEGSPVRFLVTPAIGSCTMIDQIDGWVIPAMLQGLEGEALGECVALGTSLTNTVILKDGISLNDVTALVKAVADHAKSLQETRWHLLQELGAL